MEHLNTKDFNSGLLFSSVCDSESDCVEPFTVTGAQTVGLLNGDNHDVIDLELHADNTEHPDSLILLKALEFIQMYQTF